MRSYDIIVIGAGASGLMAAITAARLQKKVLIIEHLDKIGKKIYSTGNGKCNFTNKEQGTSHYRGMNPAFVVPIFQQFSFEDTLTFFHQIGILPKEKNGYYYPYSEQASSVVEVLELELKRLNVTVLLSTELRNIQDRNGFIIRTTNGDFNCSKLIFATGLLAGRKTGCDGSAFQYIEQFGHHFIDIVPALVQMKSKDSFLKDLAGIRAEICLHLLIDGHEIYKDSGELLHIDGGLSGIVSFQASRYASYACKSGKEVIAQIDYFPNNSSDELFNILKERFHNYGYSKNTLEALIGMYPYKLALSFLKKANIQHTKSAKEISDKDLLQLSKVIKNCELSITGTKDYSDAQVCAGGIDTKELHNESLESRLHPGLFFCGELVDIDGMCGGYNLQWAWSSGYVCAIHAAK